jgi:galactokinase
MTGSFSNEELGAFLLARSPDARARAGAMRVVRSPGRVNLIGEHTDYNDGLVMPAAIDREIRICVVPTDDRQVEITLAASTETAAFDVDDVGPPRGGWIDYVTGTAWALAEAGAAVHGFRGVLASDLPSGAGLSSSAALELASAWALSGGQPPSIEPMDLARIAQRAENDYVGVRCGLMDQFAVSHGVAGSALRLDCRSLDWRPVELPGGVALVVCHSGARRRLEDSAYNERRADCERAVAVIAAAEGPAIRTLRDVDAELLERHRADLDEVAYRRARHVIGENSRVEQTERALEDGDLDAIGRLLAASHASLRDDYEVSSPALDSLVAIAAEVDGVVGARLTGAGFAGCTVNLVVREAVPAFRAAIEREHPRRTGLEPTVIEAEAAPAAGFLET